MIKHSFFGVGGNLTSPVGVVPPDDVLHVGVRLQHDQLSPVGGGEGQVVAHVGGVALRQGVVGRVGAVQELTLYFF